MKQQPLQNRVVTDVYILDMAHVERIHEMEPDLSPVMPVMEESHLQIIRALSDSQIKSKPAWAADSIQNKGKGVIILLHGKKSRWKMYGQTNETSLGPPGVGKTYSVGKPRDPSCFRQDNETNFDE